MNIIYLKKNKLPIKEKDKYECYNTTNKNYTIWLETENKVIIKNFFNRRVEEKGCTLILIIQ